MNLHPYDGAGMRGRGRHVRRDERCPLRGRAQQKETVNHRLLSG